MNDFKELILETARAHAETARAAYESREHEIAVLNGKISVLSQQIASLQLDNRMLRRQIANLGLTPSAVGSCGDSR